MSDVCLSFNLREKPQALIRKPGDQSCTYKIRLGQYTVLTSRCPHYLPKQIQSALPRQPALCSFKPLQVPTNPPLLLPNREH